MCDCQALDVVGEHGPCWSSASCSSRRNVSQNWHALPQISSRSLADRLRELEHNGVIRRGLAPTGKAGLRTDRMGSEAGTDPASSGRLGDRRPATPPPTALSATSVLIFLRGAARPDPAAPPMTCRLELDGRVWTVRLASGRVQVQPGEPATAAVSIRTEPKTLRRLLADPDTLATACADGSVAVVGDLSAIGRLHRRSPTRGPPAIRRVPPRSAIQQWPVPTPGRSPAR